MVAEGDEGEGEQGPRPAVITKVTATAQQTTAALQIAQPVAVAIAMAADPAGARAVGQAAVDAGFDVRGMPLEEARALLR